MEHQKSDKMGILDVRVITEKGTNINIEIQLINKYNMINRTLFYWSRLYSGQIKRGAVYKDLKRTITINILNFNYIDDMSYHTIYHLYEDESNKMLTDILEVQFVELPKFIEESPALNNNLNHRGRSITVLNQKCRLMEGFNYNFGLAFHGSSTFWAIKSSSYNFNCWILYFLYDFIITLIP